MNTGASAGGVLREKTKVRCFFEMTVRRFVMSRISVGESTHQPTDPALTRQRQRLSGGARSGAGAKDSTSAPYSFSDPHPRITEYARGKPYARS